MGDKMGENVAFIGLGAMGGPMAQNIIKKGTKVSVFDIFNEKMDPVIKVGGTPGTIIKDTIENAINYNDVAFNRKC